ncbi:MAG: type IV pilus secretin PilQ [Nitrospirae bacterium]|nr:type IV pilus secretin PilQ [Nitrospirota bacterium]
MRDAGSLFKRGLITILVLGLVGMGCSSGKTAVKQDKAGVLAKVQTVDVKESPDTTTVLITLDKDVTYTTVRIADPPKLVIDLAGAELGSLSGPVQVHKGPVQYVRPAMSSGSRNIARLEIGLSSPARSAVTSDGGRISISFENQPAAAAKPVSAPYSGSDAEVVTDVSRGDGGAREPGAAKVIKVAAIPEDSEEPLVSTSPKLTPVSGKPARAANGGSIPEASVVESVTCTKAGDGFTVTIAGDGRFSSPKVFMLGDDRLVVDLPGTGSLKDKDTIEVRGDCLKRIRMAEHQGADNKVRVVLDLGGKVGYDVKDEGRSLVVRVAPEGASLPAGPAQDSKAAPETAPSIRAGRKIEVVSANSPEMDKPINVLVSKEDGRAIISSSPVREEAGLKKVDVLPAGAVETGTKIYTGGKISFDIQNAELENVINLLADVASLNLILDSSSVKGNVTLKLDAVPWDQALDILLRIYNLDKVIEGNVLRVAPKSKLDDERRRDLLQIAEQKKLEQQAEDLYTRTFKASYTTAGELESQVKKILSARGDATANQRTNELIVTDVKEKLEKAEKLIAVLDKGVNQIMIEARIVTVDINYSQSLGISWGIRRIQEGADSKLGQSFATGSNSSLKYTTGDRFFDIAVPTALKATGAGAVGGMFWENIAEGVLVDMTISALETISKAEVLAAPKVLTLENQSASITSGTTLYVQTTSASGTKPEPLNANLSLTVTPRVTGDNFIMMDVVATNNQPGSPPPGATAAIDTKSVTTKVMVKDGATIVLGGIYLKSKTKGDSQVPLLGRIPVLGWLFKERNISENTSELLIFITPKLVKQQI